MNTVHPSYLWALILLAIPILVHLFNLRKYSKVYFTNTNLLKTILSETQKTSKLKKRLLLASRLLAMLFIILAFVQPIINSVSSNQGQGQPIVSIYIDNSYSMGAPSSELVALEEAKQKAIEILESIENQGLFQILSNDFEGNQLQLLSYTEARDLVNSITLSPNRRTANEIWEKQIKTTRANESERKSFYWLSDFQKNQFEKIKESSIYPLTCVPIVHSKKRNIYIDTAYIYSQNIKANENVQIIYRLKKSADDLNDKSLVTLSVNDAVKNRKEILWKNQSIIIDTLTIKLVATDWQFLKLTISDASIEFDNEYFFTFYLSPKPYVTLVNQGSNIGYLTNALKTDNNFDVHNFSNLELPDAELAHTNLIILNELNKFEPSSKVNDWLKSNKNVAIILPDDVDISKYNSSLASIGIQQLGELKNDKARIKLFNLQDATLQNIFTRIDKLSDLPSFSNYYTLIGHSDRAKEGLISLDNGQSLLTKYSRLGEGNVYLFSASFSSAKSDFVYSSIFAPLLYKLGVSAVSHQLNSYFIGSENNVVIPIGAKYHDKVYKIVGNQISVIPPQRKIGNTLQCQLHESLNQAGFYSIVSSGGMPIYRLALNHKRNESHQEFLSSREISEVLGYENLVVDSSNGNYLKNINSFTGINLWKLMVILAALFLFFEMMIVLFWDRFTERWTFLKL